MASKANPYPETESAGGLEAPEAYHGYNHYFKKDMIVSKDRSNTDNKAFTYLTLAGTRFTYASFGRAVVLKVAASMSASADVLALSSLEVDLAAVLPGTSITVKWRGKPVFIRRRTQDEISMVRS